MSRANRALDIDLGTCHGGSTMRQVLIAVSLFAMCASVALVAQYRFLPDSPGTWKPWVFRADAD